MKPKPTLTVEPNPVQHDEPVTLVITGSGFKRFEWLQIRGEAEPLWGTMRCSRDGDLRFEYTRPAPYFPYPGLMIIEARVPQDNLYGQVRASAELTIL